MSIFCTAVRQDHAQNAFPNSRGRALLSCKFLFRQYGRRYDDALDAYERSPHFPKTSLCKRKCSTLYRISQFVHAPWRVFPGRRPSRSTLQCAVAVCWSVLECAAGVCWCLLKCAEVCCSVLQSAHLPPKWSVPKKKMAPRASVEGNPRSGAKLLNV